MFIDILIAKLIFRFSAWPEDALELVANKFLTQIEMESEIRKECVQMCKHFHTSVSNISERYVILLSSCVIVIHGVFLMCR
jgi:dynein heavy chain